MRTGFPLVGPGCDGEHEQLEAIRQELAYAAGSRWPSQPPEFFDISFLDPGELKGVDERHMFGPNFIRHRSANNLHFDKLFMDACLHLSGSKAECPESLQPADMNYTLKHELAKSFERWDGDSLEVHIKEVRAMLQRKRSPPLIIFFHCACGCDRTGAFFAAYAMRYLNMSMADAMLYNTWLMDRPMIYRQQMAVQWYCTYLSARGLYTHGDCETCWETNLTEVCPAMDLCMHSDGYASLECAQLRQLIWNASNGVFYLSKIDPHNSMAMWTPELLHCDLHIKSVEFFGVATANEFVDRAGGRGVLFLLGGGTWALSMLAGAALIARMLGSIYGLPGRRGTLPLASDYLPISDAS